MIRRKILLLCASLSLVVLTACNRAINTQDRIDSHTGVIVGSLSYPSEDIPDFVYACARHRDTDDVTCTRERIYSDSYLYGVGYQLDVPMGEYVMYQDVIFEESVTDIEDYVDLIGLYPRYYSPYSRCILSNETDCTATDHEPYVVTVTKTGTFVDEEIVEDVFLTL